MNNIKKSYRFTILDEEYSLVSDESEEHMQQVTQLVDSYMREIANNVTIKNKSRIAVLAAIRLASLFLNEKSTNESHNTYKQKLIDLIDNELAALSSI